MVASLVAFALAGTVASIVVTRPSKSVAVYLIRRCATPADCVPAGVVRQMKDETSQIWSSLDVRIDWIDSNDPTAMGGPAIGLTVMLEGSADPDIRRRLERGLVLAIIHQPDLPCGPALARVWVKHARRHAASVRHETISPGAMPDALTNLYFARALGRAVAHEIGHYALGNARHTPEGLMRARFAPQELVQPANDALYGLDHRHRNALRPCRVSPETLIAEPDAMTSGTGHAVPRR